MNALLLLHACSPARCAVPFLEFLILITHVYKSPVPRWAFIQRFTFDQGATARRRKTHCERCFVAGEIDQSSTFVTRFEQSIFEGNCRWGKERRSVPMSCGVLMPVHDFGLVFFHRLVDELFDHFAEQRSECVIVGSTNQISSRIHFDTVETELFVKSTNSHPNFFSANIYQSASIVNDKSIRFLQSCKITRLDSTRLDEEKHRTFCIDWFCLLLDENEKNPNLILNNFFLSSLGNADER